MPPVLAIESTTRLAAINTLQRCLKSISQQIPASAPIGSEPFADKLPMVMESIRPQIEQNKLLKCLEDCLLHLNLETKFGLEWCKSIADEISTADIQTVQGPKAKGDTPNTQPLLVSDVRLTKDKLKWAEL